MWWCILQLHTKTVMFTYNILSIITVKHTYNILSIIAVEHTYNTLSITTVMFTCNTLTTTNTVTPFSYHLLRISSTVDWSSCLNTNSVSERGAPIGITSVLLLEIYIELRLSVMELLYNNWCNLTRHSLDSGYSDDDMIYDVIK